MSDGLSLAAARRIIADVADQTGVAVADIVGDRRLPAFVAARQAVYREMRAAGATLPRIGRLMQRHHTTVLYALQGIVR